LMLIWIPISPIFISEMWLILTFFTQNPYLTALFILSFIFMFSGIIVSFSRLFEEKKWCEIKKIQERFKINSIFLPIFMTILLWIGSIASLIFIL
jgi:formate hydrogenlyase subunit 3/multisubunit Na+/H+ antiporter MnhD subunit